MLCILPYKKNLFVNKYFMIYLLSMRKAKIISQNNLLQRKNSRLQSDIDSYRTLFNTDVSHKDMTADMLLNFKWSDPANLTLNDYNDIYKFNVVAKAIINKPARQTWKKRPLLITKSDREKKILNELFKTFSIFPLFESADRLCHLAEYSIIVFGFPGAPETPVDRASTIAWIQEYGQLEAIINTYDHDKLSPRYGQPLTYKIRAIVGDMIETVTYHWTRVIHISRTSKVKSDPYLMDIYNQAKDMIKEAGAGSEGIFRAACYILGIEVDKESPLLEDASEFDLLEDSAKKKQPLMETMIRAGKKTIDRGFGVVTVQGGKLKSMQSRPASPIPSFDTNSGLVSMKTEYPKRMFTGNEAGELASTQDRDSMNDTTRSRQTNFAIPYILNLFIDRLILLKFINPIDYYWKFDVLSEPTAKETAETNKLKSETIKNLISAFALGLGTLVSEKDIVKLYPELFIVPENEDV